MNPKQSNISRFWNKLSIVLLVAIFYSLVPGAIHAQEGATGFAEYQNRLYTTTPNTVPGVSDPQPKTISFFSGQLNDKNDLSVPSDGTYKLVQSAFGFPVAGGLKADVLFGGIIEPPANADTNYEPTIDPGTTSKAFSVFTAGSWKVYASEPGYVTITWKDSAGSDLLPAEEYLIGNQPERSPVGLYHTHNPDADLSSGSAVPPQTGAPAVDLSSIEEVIFHWNAAVPQFDANSNPYLIRNNANQLYAREKTGLIVLEYRQNGEFLDIEIVALRSSRQPSGPPTAISIGDQLLPFAEGTDLSQLPAPFVAKGLNEGLVYQHNQGSRQRGHLFAVERVTNSQNLEVYWQRYGVQDVAWPYELHRYTSDWPTDSSKYQIYARGSSESAHGTEVSFPSDLNAELMPFQAPEGHAHGDQ